MMVDVMYHALTPLITLFAFIVFSYYFNVIVSHEKLTVAKSCVRARARACQLQCSGGVASLTLHPLSALSGRDFFFFVLATLA